MTKRAWGNEYRTTTVCIDSYESGVMSGRFYNSYLDSGVTFQSLTQFLVEMERTLDRMEFPRSFTAARTFAPVPHGRTAAPDFGFCCGARATFAVRVIFRQNASWQGSLLWLEGEREQSFRSVLELILLMDSALNQKDEKAG